MAEQTNPATGVAQEPLDVQQQMENFLTKFDGEQSPPQQAPEQPTAAPPVEAQQPEDLATEELTPDDIPGEEPQAQSAVDEFEIVHNGQQRKLSREETIRLAQQGFDYTQKTQALAEQSKQVQAQLQRVQEMEQMQAALAPDLATVKAIEAQLAPYQNVDWVKVVQEQGSDAYAMHRANYDKLVHAYQAAVGQFQQKAGVVQQQKAMLTQQILGQQREKMLEAIPAWRDPAKFQQEAPQVRDYLIREGLDPAQVENLSDARAVVIAYKAMQYDRLSKAKADKVKQAKSAPPMTRPGASQSPGQAQTEQRKQQMARLRKTGDLRDAAALLVDRI